MPALFAYVLAVGLLLGGGYGALSWLAAPEPVKIVAKAKQQPRSTQTASSFEAPLAQPSPAHAGETAQVHAASNDNAQSSAPAAPGVMREEGVVDNVFEPTPPQQSVLHTEAAAAETTSSPPQRESELLPSQGNKHAIDTASAATSNRAAAGKPKRPHLRQAERPPEKRALALMTLRTIEFPDGRRATMLIPYRENRRVALGPAW